MLYFKSMKILKLTFSVLIFLFFSCVVFRSDPDGIDWNQVSCPGTEGIAVYSSQEEAEAAGGGWFVTMNEEFEGNALPKEWVASPHGVRWQSQSASHPEWTNYWCPDMITVRDGKVEIHSLEKKDHQCSEKICAREGRFTSGIETRRLKSDGKGEELLFAQAFGYFEATVKFPKARGMWSAFWLQIASQNRVGDEGSDGTEIDVYESAFLHRYSAKENRSMMGHALLWDGYGNDGKVEDFKTWVYGDLYDGFHTFGLKWTPAYYIFYIDGRPTWMTKAGGVSKVREFLRLTCEIDAGDTYGPHGQRIGRFDDRNEPVFYIDSVRVWQHTDFLKSVKEIDDFQ